MSRLTWPKTSAGIWPESDSRVCRSARSTEFARVRCPVSHKDPFDRMLVAQAQIEDLVIVSNDVQLRMGTA